MDEIADRCRDLSSRNAAVLEVGPVAAILASEGNSHQEVAFGNDNDPFMATAKILGAIALENSVYSRQYSCADLFLVYLSMRQEGSTPKQAMDDLRNTMQALGYQTR